MRLLFVGNHQQHLGVHVTSCLRTAAALLMFLHIATTIILTFTEGSTYAASLTKVRHRAKLRSVRETEKSSNESTKESLGTRECSQEERQKQGCLAGSCAALVTSQLHTFIICRCPADRQGARCEEIAINTDSIAEVLKEQTQEELCKQERYDLLAKSLGYESLFVDCVNRNYQIDVPRTASEKSKNKQRLKKKRERERARKRKLRKRRRDKKKSQRSIEKSSTSTGDSDIDIGDSNVIDHFSNLFLSPKELKKKVKDHTGHNHKVRHENEKSLSRRRRKSLTTFLVGTLTPLTPTLSSGRKPTSHQ